MTTNEFVDYVCSEYKKIFKDQYNEDRAKSSAERLLVINSYDLLNAKDAADAIIEYVKSKRESKQEIFDDKEQLLPPKWIFKYKDHEVSILGDDRISIDGEIFNHRVEILRPFAEVMNQVISAVDEKLLEKGTERLKSVPEELKKVKEMISTAPKEVLHSFNNVVNYFDSLSELEELSRKLNDKKKISIKGISYDLIKSYIEDCRDIILVYGSDGRLKLNANSANELITTGSTSNGEIELK